MNPRQWATLVWLRWRMLVNQIRRQSTLTRIYSVVMLSLAALSSLSAFVSTLALAGWIFPAEVPGWLVFAVDGFVAAFLFSWFWGVVVDLQQSQVLSLDKFLHLPVSTRGILVMNYASSLLSLNLLFFGPTSLALALVMAGRYGGWMWLAPLLLLAFYFMITAMTWQFRGWLASLMADKRRRQTIIALGSSALIVVAFAPQYLLGKFDSDKEDRKKSAIAVARQDLEQQRQAGTITADEFDEKKELLDQERDRQRNARLARFASWVRTGNRVLPPGWMAEGIESAGQGRGWISLACLAGMLSIGSVSLVRSMKTSMRLVRGGFDKQSWRVKTKIASDADDRNAGTGHHGMAGDGPASLPATPPPNWIEWNWPLLNQPQAAIASGTLRGLSRMASVKLAMVWPVLILIFVGGTATMGKKLEMPIDLRAVTGAGICFFIMMGATQLIQNQRGRYGVAE